MMMYDIFVSLEIVRQDMREKIIMRVRERERAGDMNSVGWFFAFSFFCSMELALFLEVGVTVASVAAGNTSER